MANDAPANPNRRLGDPELRRIIERFVRRRAPQSETDDLVQTILCAAIDSDFIPDGDEPLRKWLMGIARHKVADFHRAGGRAKFVELPADIKAEAPAHSAREWARWAEKQTGDNPEDQRTLQWMARQGDGEKLARIAEDEQVPAPQMRQRVSRLRQAMRHGWKKELAAVAAIIALSVLAIRFRPDTTQIATPDPVPRGERLAPMVERGRQLRAEALETCRQKRWPRCIKELDEAKRLDPEGDQNATVGAARDRAREAMRTPTAPTAKDVAPNPKTPPSSSTDPAQTKRVPKRSVPPNFGRKKAFEKKRDLSMNRKKMNRLPNEEAAQQQIPGLTQKTQPRKKRKRQPPTQKK